jgi:hypothetical protein
MNVIRIMRKDYEYSDQMIHMWVMDIYWGF